MVNRVHQPRIASLPPRQSIQNTNVAGRPRVSHLPGIPRVYLNTLPKGFPSELQVIFEQETISESALSCGNAAFQVLLNIPIFVNFVRAHIRRRCAITNCLTCAISDVASLYWVKELDELSQLALGEKLELLWQRCLKTSWGRSRIKHVQTGWVDINGDVYTESLLLNFLVETQSQLERYPSDFQTFQRLFTSHVARRWKCSFEHCGHISTPFWESSLYLPIDVQKYALNRPQTTIIEGLHRGLQRWTTETSSKDTSIMASGKCEKCGQDASAYNEIVNMPEVLILVRNITELSSRDLPDIAYSETLELELTVPNKASRVKASFSLLSGTAEARSRSNSTRHAIAFARGATNDVWFAIDNEIVDETRDLSELDTLQRPSKSRPIQSCLFPEMFVYYRTDKNGLKNYGQLDQIAVHPVTPLMLDSASEKRKMVGTSISDIFTQKIGKGILKFKIDMWPAEPSSDQVVDFTIHLGYEIDQNHWDGTVQDKLNPVALSGPYLPPDTPFDLNPVTRVRRRMKGDSPTDIKSKPQFWPSDSKSTEMEVDPQWRFVPVADLAPTVQDMLMDYKQEKAKQGRRKHKHFGGKTERLNGGQSNHNNNQRSNIFGIRGSNRGGKGRGGMRPNSFVRIGPVPAGRGGRNMKGRFKVRGGAI